MEHAQCKLQIIIIIHLHYALNKEMSKMNTVLRIA